MLCYLETLQRRTKQFEDQIKQVENKRSNEYHLILMRNQTIPIESNFVRKDREDSPTYFGVPYRLEIQIPKLEEFTSERQIIREKSQCREIDSLDSKYLERQALRKP